MSTKIPVICHNIKDYDSHLIIKEVIPNTFSFKINRNLAFTDSMQFMESRLDSLAKHLMDEDFRYSSEEFKLAKKKDVYLYEQF